MKWASFLRFLGISSSTGETYPDGNYLGTLNNKEVTVYNTTQPLYRLVYDHHVEGIRLLNVQAIKKNKRHINAVMVLSKAQGDNEYKILIKPGDRPASLKNRTQKLLCVVKNDYKIKACNSTDSTSTYTMDWSIKPFVNGYKIKDSATKSCLVRDTDNGILKIESCSTSTPEQRFDMLEVADDPYKSLYLGPGQLLSYEMQSAGDGGSLPSWMINGLAGGSDKPSHNPNNPNDNHGYGESGNPYEGEWNNSPGPDYWNSRQPWNGPNRWQNSPPAPNNQPWMGGRDGQNGQNGTNWQNGNNGQNGQNWNNGQNWHNGHYNGNNWSGHNYNGQNWHNYNGNNGNTGYNGQYNGHYNGYNGHGSNNYNRQDGYNGHYNGNNWNRHGSNNYNGNNGTGWNGPNHNYNGMNGPNGHNGNNWDRPNYNGNNGHNGNNGNNGPNWPNHNGHNSNNLPGLPGMNNPNHIINLNDLGNNIVRLKEIVKTLKTFCTEAFSDFGLCAQSGNMSAMSPEQIQDLIRKYMHPDQIRKLMDNYDKNRKSRYRRDIHEGGYERHYGDSETGRLKRRIIHRRHIPVDRYGPGYSGYRKSGYDSTDGDGRYRDRRHLGRHRGREMGHPLECYSMDDPGCRDHSYTDRSDEYRNYHRPSRAYNRHYSRIYPEHRIERHRVHDY